jgi:hypothetical protein
MRGRRKFRLWMPVAGLALVSVAAVSRESRSSPAVYRRLHVDGPAFAPGDVVFRRGRSLISRAVLAADGDGEYSHVGLIAVSAGRVWVLHATPDEAPDIKGGVLAEPLEAFLAPEYASAAALYRPRDARAGRAAERAAWGWVHARLPFDDAFDFESADKLYCTELVWRAYQSTGIDLEAGVSGPRGRYLLPGRLAKSPQLQRMQLFQEEAIKP